MKIEDIYKLYTKTYLVDTDTRKIRKGSIFFALKGDNFDGNKFAKTALENGAAYAIVDDAAFVCNSRTILVSNTLDTLQELAQYHRKKLGITIIALTGSNGKTTTKELIYYVLKEQFNVVATLGNLNNHIGVPLTLLTMTPKTEIGLVEMGANHLKEIEFLCKIAQPNYGYITNFGKAHLEGFGGVKGVIKGKSELYNYLKLSNGSAFINTNDPLQIKQAKDLKTIPFGSSEIKLLESNQFVSVLFNDIKINSNLIGTYNFSNIAAAIAIGNYFKIPTIKIKQGIESYIPQNHRSQIIEKNGIQIIMDAYNANPSSMQAALSNFNTIKSPIKIAILGDMFELGEASAVEHQSIANLALSLNLTKVYLIGKAFSAIDAKNAFVYDNFDSFKESFNPKDLYQATILIKGSRGMALERVLDFF